MLDFNEEMNSWNAVYNKISLNQIGFLIDWHDPIKDVFPYQDSNPKIQN